MGTYTCFERTSRLINMHISRQCRDIQLTSVSYRHPRSDVLGDFVREVRMALPII
jgi:hypothetical protein